LSNLALFLRKKTHLLNFGGQCLVTDSRPLPISSKKAKRTTNIGLLVLVRILLRDSIWGIGIWLERFALLDLLISVCFLIERDKLSIGLNARLWEREYLILAQAGGNMEVFSKDLSNGGKGGWGTDHTLGG